MTVAAGAVVRLLGVFLFTVAADDDEGIEVEGRTLDPIHAIITVGEEAVLDAFVVLAIRGEREDIGGVLQNEPGGRVEDVLPEVQDQRGEYEDQSPPDRFVADDVYDPFVVERDLVYDPRTHVGIRRHDPFEFVRVADHRYPPSAALESAAVGQGVLGVFGKPPGIEERPYEEHLAPVRSFGGREPPHLAGLPQGDPRIPPDPGRVLGLSRSHGTDDEYTAAGTDEVEVVERVMDGELGESQALQKCDGVSVLYGRHTPTLQHGRSSANGTRLDHATGS